MDNEGSIRTQFDELLVALKSSGGAPKNVHSLSSTCGMPEKAVLDWLHVLERSGQVRLENRLSGVYASWTGEMPSPLHMPKISPEAPLPLPRPSVYNLESDIERAHEIEESAKRPRKSVIAEPEKEEELPGEAVHAKIPLEQPQEIAQGHRAILESVDSDLASVGKQIEQVESMIAKLKEAKQQQAAAKKLQQGEKEKEKAAEENQPQAGILEEVEKEILSHPSQSEARLEPEGASIFEEQQAAKQQEKPETAFPLAIKPLEKEQEGVVRVPTLSYERAKEIARKKSKAHKIKRPEPVQITNVSLQFSEKLARQIKKIISQTQQIESLRMEKEKLLTEHYLPMQRRLESEIETISDRILRMEKNIVGLHQRASDLPGKVTEVEKLQLSSLKAHGQMRRAYDEASALIEESNRLLSEEREKLEMVSEQSRQEIAAHRAKTEELEGVLSEISQMELEASNRVMQARATLAEQAERLASAETHAKELTSLKEEIAQGVTDLKREISATKGILTGIDKQMEQMRQVELYTESLRNDYDKKIGELGDYVRHGNEEFDTLRESVEANFVRRYLRELRQLTDSYTFEFNQVKKTEEGIDKRVEEEKKNLESLLEEGRKISYLYELQAKEPAGAEKFEQHTETFRSVNELSAQRSQIEQLIAQVVSKRSDYQPKKGGANMTVSAPKVKKAQAPKKAAKAKASKAKEKKAKKR